LFGIAERPLRGQLLSRDVVQGGLDFLPGADTYQADTRNSKGNKSA